MKKKYRCVYADGCYDICHFGHYNFVRQASELGENVIAGVHNDEVITSYKGPPVYNLSERMMMIEACKWVTKAIPDAPFNITVKWLDQINCDCSIHGDDIVVNDDGESCYASVIKAGRFQTVQRAKSISTTNLIGRILRLPNLELPEGFDKPQLKDFKNENDEDQAYVQKFISLFSNNKRPHKNDRIVYCFGKFDLLHPGHISFLKKAKELGDFLIVGVCDDGPNTIMKLNERILNVLSMKYVDDVIIGSPNIVTEELISQINPSIVVEGSKSSSLNVDPYEIPKKLGIYRKIDSDFPDFTAKTVINRILENYSIYVKRNSIKESLPCENCSL